MNSVWRPIQNPPVLPKLHLSEEGQSLFNYISQLYHRPTAGFQSQQQPIKDDETWFFPKQTDTFGDSHAHQTILNPVEIRIKAELIEESEISSRKNNFDGFNSNIKKNTSAKLRNWIGPFKKRLIFEETEEDILCPKKYDSPQIMSKDENNYGHYFTSEYTQKNPHPSPDKFPFTHTSSSSQGLRVYGIGTPPLFNKFDDSTTHLDILNPVEIKIEPDELEVSGNETYSQGENFMKYHNINWGDQNSQSYNWTVPSKRKLPLIESEERIPSPKKYYSQMIVSQDKTNYGHHFTSGHTESIPNCSQGTFRQDIISTSPFTPTASNFQFCHKIRRSKGDGSIIFS